MWCLFNLKVHPSKLLVSVLSYCTHWCVSVLVCWYSFFCIMNQTISLKLQSFLKRRVQCFFIFDQIHKMLCENESLPEEQFNLDVEEQRRLEAMVEQEAEKVLQDQMKITPANRQLSLKKYFLTLLHCTVEGWNWAGHYREVVPPRCPEERMLGFCNDQIP